MYALAPSDSGADFIGYVHTPTTPERQLASREPPLDGTAPRAQRLGKTAGMDRLPQRPRHPTRNLPKSLPATTDPHRSQVAFSPLYTGSEGSCLTSRASPAESVCLWKQFFVFIHFG